MFAFEVIIGFHFFLLTYPMQYARDGQLIKLIIIN